MIGRGRAGEELRGGPQYLQLIGARRLSRDLGALIERVNTNLKRPFQLDTAHDAPNDPENMYCRSDHAMYAGVGIPVAYLTTGLHGDYHAITDESRYIDFGKLEAVTRFVIEIAAALGNQGHRPALSGSKADAASACR